MTRRFPRSIAAVEASLKRLGTDYLDLVHIHAVNSIDRLMAPNIHEAFDRLKQAGKVRFLGVSSHTPDLETVMRHAVESGGFDVIMVAYNFKNWPDLHDIFHRAHQRGMGVVAMKTLKGAYHGHLAEFTPTERESFAQAAFKWVLSNDDVSGLVVTMTRFGQIDEYLFASGKKPSGDDVALLEKYDRLIARRLLPPGLRGMSRRLPVRRPGRRRPALRDVRRELRPGERGDAQLRGHRPAAPRRPLRRLLRALRGALPVRDPDARRAEPGPRPFELDLTGIHSRADARSHRRKRGLAQ